MTLRLIREPTKDGATLGVLFVDGVFQCFTLEDPIRQDERPVSAWKVPGDTAIPSGRYGVSVTHSPRFNRQLPLLNGVPGFEGVRIHPGNRSSDTEGCIIPGRIRGQASVMESRLAFEMLYARMMLANGPMWIEIENPR